MPRKPEKLPSPPPKRTPSPPNKRGSRPSTTTGKTKESPALSDASLAVLSRELGPHKSNCLVLPMYLNIPNTTIVNTTNNASECGLIDAADRLKIETLQKLLLHWKSLKVSAGAKEREKIRELERALREMGNAEIADILTDKHSNQLELTADAFAAVS